MKIGLIISVLLLVGTNVFWMYQATDTAIGIHYRKVSCEEYRKDANQLFEALKLIESKEEMMNWLRNNKIEYNGFDKGTQYVMQFNSFDFVFSENGELLETNQN